MPLGVMIPVTSSGGVTSKPGFSAGLPGLAIRTCLDRPPGLTPQAPVTSSCERSSIGMDRQSLVLQSNVDHGAAT